MFYLAEFNLGILDLLLEEPVAGCKPCKQPTEAIFPTVVLH